MRRVFLASSSLTLITSNIAMLAIGVAKTPGFFSQPASRTFVLEPVFALLSYAVAVVFIARTRGPYWDSILKTATVFGALTATLEVINIGVENGVPFAVRGPILSIGFMLIIFTLWGIAGFRTARSLRSARAGVIAAVSSACICMMITVAAGFIIELFLVPPEPAFVLTWAEFKRSGWTDARSFGVANTLDSGFTHLVIAPVVALFFGGLASLLAQFSFSAATPTSR